jgi:hypothetical protein
VTHIQTWYINYQNKLADQLPGYLINTVVTWVLTRFFYFLLLWPSFSSEMTHVRTYLSNYLDKHPWQVWWQLSKKCNLWSLNKVFSICGRCKLVFDCKWPIFKLDIEIIKTNFLTIFKDIWITIVTTSVLTRFFYF